MMNHTLKNIIGIWKNLYGLMIVVLVYYYWIILFLILKQCAYYG